MWKLIKPLKPRGIRFSLPMGFLLGRVSPGYGDAELIPIDQIARELIKTTILPGPTTKTPVAEIGFFLAASQMSPGQYFYLAMSNAVATFPSTQTVPAAAVHCKVAPTSTVTLYVVNNLTDYETNGPAGSPSGVIATIQFTTGQTTGTITWASGQPFTVNAGDVLYLVVADTFADTVIEGVTCILIGDYVSG